VVLDLSRHKVMMLCITYLYHALCHVFHVYLQIAKRRVVDQCDAYLRVRVYVVAYRVYRSLPRIARDRSVVCNKLFASSNSYNV